MSGITRPTLNIPNGIYADYMSCYQLHITGSGSKTPAGVNFPGAYSPVRQIIEHAHSDRLTTVFVVLE